MLQPTVMDLLPQAMVPLHMSQVVLAKDSSMFWEYSVVISQKKVLEMDVYVMAMVLHHMMLQAIVLHHMRLLLQVMMLHLILHQAMMLQYLHMVPLVHAEGSS